MSSEMTQVEPSIQESFHGRENPSFTAADFQLPDELRAWMKLMHKTVMKIEMSTASQEAMMKDLQTTVNALTPAPPQELPPQLPLCPVPNTLQVEANANVSAQRALSRSVGSDKLGAGAELPKMKSQNQAYANGMKVPGCLDELEDLTASQLLSRFRPSGPSGPSRRVSMLSMAEPSSELPKQTKKSSQTAVVNSKMVGEERSFVLNKSNKMSMEQLRQSYDEIVATRGSGTREDTGATVVSTSSLPSLGSFLLCLVGHRQFGSGPTSRCLAICSYAIVPTACTIPLLCVADVSAKWNFTLILTLCCFQLGVSFASHSLKSNGLDTILGPRDRQLDEYAINADFMPDWQHMSRRRLMETVGTYLVLLLVAVAVNIFAGEFSVSNAFGLEGWQVAWYFEGAFWLMFFRYLMLCYSILHVSSGFELALDSFALTFFKDMDIEEAIENWNILQATLRQVSTKLSHSLCAMGLCCLISLALLAEQVIFNADEVSANMLGWALKFYPTVLFFLYTMIRAAAVTEKANRVAPLVNSWKFQEVDPMEDKDQESPWMDQARHYAVQYIIQSQAGFYVTGAQLTFPAVWKLFYYFGVVSFALTSRLLA